jgi:hypothetical protein
MGWFVGEISESRVEESTKAGGEPILKTSFCQPTHGKIQKRVNLITYQDDIIP